MRRPKETISEKDVNELVPGGTIVGKVVKGGQKAVVPIKLNGEKVALKILFLDSVDPNESEPNEAASAPPFAEARERIRREVRILAGVSIPQLARTGPVPLGEGVVDDCKVLFYSEEWVDGVDLGTLVARHERLSSEDTIKLGLDVTTAIEWLWAHSKVHRDIKPGNIMKRSDGGFVLLDLGYALDLRDRSLTNAGFVVGTPRYFSPEHLDLKRKRNMDFRSDIYCLGVTMYEASTGNHPYYRGGMDGDAIIRSVLESIPTPPADLTPGFPTGLSNIIMRMMAKFPHLRYQSCAKLKSALEIEDHEIGEEA